MKKIILLLDEDSDTTALANLSELADVDLVKTKDANRALRLLRRHSPDFVLCTGRIRQKENGRYILEL
ncbi:hypothetical protein JW964_07205 [candidate division KSB1 bacterium]|nr:hypothetical protein [candidate division KSB1 bacterium]